MEFKDHFSGQARQYAQYRPWYPKALFAFLADVSPGRRQAWDVATGGGQAASGLAAYFDHVWATDASASQIANRIIHPNITYRVSLAEASGLSNDSIDLVTVAQALHWFDTHAFFREVRRVSKPEGLIAIWGYDLLTVAPEIDIIVSRFYRTVLAGYWPDERCHIDTHYASLPFPFRRISTPEFEMVCHWNRDHFLGYLGTWSAVSRCRDQTGNDPLTELKREIAPHWLDQKEVKKIVWPLFMRLGRVHSRGACSE